MEIKKVGYYLNEKGIPCIKVYAPYCKQLSIVLDESKQEIELEKNNNYFEKEIPELIENTKYWLKKDNEKIIPDPYSHYQPNDVLGASMAKLPKKVELNKWQGIDIDDAIIYELHLGTFTPEGNLKSAKSKIAYLKKLGINVIELMPIAAFPGNRNWGYDGTYLFAINSSYGDYEDLKLFIEEAHNHNIAVILDVVYNHFGPEGNFSGELGPFTKNAQTPWGSAINFDRRNNIGVREFYLYNTYYWLKEVGFDGFRMDATALILDSSKVHILREINLLAQQIGKEESRKIIMIAENLRNENKVVSSKDFSFSAQWVDDLNYALYAFLTKETHRHYRDFGSFNDIVKVLKESYAYDGTKYNSVYNHFMGENGSFVKPYTCVVHIQNHDQIGNRLHGDRMCATYGYDKALVAITTIFTSPYTPMIFMGEEYGEKAPFNFFESFMDSRLIEAVKRGRNREWGFSNGKDKVFPHDEALFIESKLNWDLHKQNDNKSILEIYTKLIELKKKRIIGVRNRESNKFEVDFENEILYAITDKSITVINLSDRDVDFSNLKINTQTSLLLNIDLQNRLDKLYAYTAKIFAR